MNYRRIISISIIVFAFLFVLKKDQLRLQDLIVPKRETVETSTGGSVISAPAIPASENAPIKQESVLTEIAPKLSALRADVRKNPHQTPQSYLKFAAVLAKKMDLATDEHKRRNLFEELAECTLSPDLSVNVQALCLSNAKRLSVQEPGLNGLYERLQTQAKPEVAKLAD